MSVNRLQGSCECTQPAPAPTLPARSATWHVRPPRSSTTPTTGTLPAQAASKGPHVPRARGAETANVRRGGGAENAKM
eukprot:6054035-Prymnesium_polylepis.1